MGGTLVLAGGGGFAALENHVVSSYGEGVWWALSLMTTVGFVGESPETPSGRAVSAVLMVAGFALMTVTTAAVASTLVREEEEPDLAAERDFEESTRQLLSDIAARLEISERAMGVDREIGSPGPVMRGRQRSGDGDQY
jgi:voltage-gated potassium channel